MKWLAGALLAVMIAWSAVMAGWSPSPAPKGAVPLVWTSDDNPQRADQVELFNRLHPEIHVKLDPANQGMEKVIVQAMGGVGPDLFDCRDSTQLSSFVQAGIALDVTQALADRGIDVKRDTFEAMQPMALWQGRTYGVPTNIAPNALWLHKDVFAQAGIAVPKAPWKWDSLVPLARRLTVRKNGRVERYGFLFDWWNWAHFFRGYGADLFTPDGRKCIVDAPGAVAAVQLMHDLVYVYKVSPTPVEEAGMASKGGWGTGTINLFGARRGAMALGGRWWLVNLRKFDGLKLGVVESPYGTVRAFSALGRATVVNSRSPRREEALKFLLYLASRPYAVLVDRQADGSPVFKKHADIPAPPGEPDPEVWTEAARHTVPDWASPYVNGYVVNQIIGDQLDLVRTGAKTPAQAMKEAARQINAEIAKSINSDPRLKERYEGGSK